MTRRLGDLLLTAVVTIALGPIASAAPPPRDRPISPEQAVVDALRANPLVLPYAIRVTTGKSGEIILSGKVGTKPVHDLAIRTVIDLGYVPHDDLTIDTAQAARVAAEQTYQAGGPVAATLLGRAPYFVYPEPLFGRLDEPFWGFEPPILSIPPYAARVAAPPAQTADERLRRASVPVKGQIQLTVDEFGQVFLSGIVASEEDKRIIEHEAMSAPGVTRVSSDLRIAGRESPPPRRSPSTAVPSS